MVLLDISRAHLHLPLARAVFVAIDGKVHKLLKAMCGLRDAGAAFAVKVFDVMNLMNLQVFDDESDGSVIGEVQHLCLWGDWSGLCVGVTISPRVYERLHNNAFRDELGKYLLIKTTGVMGPNVDMDNVQEAIHLNGLLRLYPTRRGRS